MEQGPNYQYRQACVMPTIHASVTLHEDFFLLVMVKQLAPLR